MKVLSLVALCYWIIVVSSDSTKSSEDLLSRASAQLERLAPYRRTSTDQKQSDEQWQSLDNPFKDYTSRMLNEQRTAFEIYKLLPESLQDDIAKRIGANRATIELLGDSKYMAMMQERIKRSGQKRGIEEHEEYEHSPHSDGYPPYGYPSPPEEGGSDSGAIIKGSTSLISGIANGIISGLVSASSSASKGSSSVSASSSSSASATSSDSSNFNKKPEYGHAYSYEDKEFGVWDFKKVIMSTLMQAVKAISGGVIALKGQILKGSGYLVSAKGKVITKTGDAITSLGRNIAKSAAYPSHQEHPHPGYSYDVPPHGDHHETYDGPPPSIEEYAEQNHRYHESFHDESPSDVDDEAGLLIAKPMNPDGHDHHTLDTDSQKPALTQPEDGYHGPPPGLPEKHVENSLTADYQNQINHNQVTELDHPPNSDHPPSSYEVSIHPHQLDEHTKGQAYPIYPPLTSDLPVNLPGPFSIQQSVEYPPIHIQYAVPNKGSFDLSNGDNGNDLSVYSSLSIDVDPKIKLSTLKQENGFELPKLQPDVNLQSLPLLPNYSSLQGPLKIPLLKPLSVPYWPNQGLDQPIGSFGMHGWYRRRNSVQRRRSINDVAHMRLHRG